MHDGLHGDVRVQGAVEGRIALGRELHVGQRVREVVVLPGGVDDQIRLEVRQHGQHGVLDGVKVALVRGLGRQGDVDGAAQRVRPAAFLREARARIEGAAVLMQEMNRVFGSFQKMSWLPSPWCTSVSTMAMRGGRPVGCG